MPTASAPAKRSTAKPPGARPAAPAAGTPARWWKVALLVALGTIGLPLAHALFGGMAAMLGGAVLLGFLLGRWTAK
ncbi:MAG: hypothetical protein O9325_12920 [Roseomonas sp.]|nr:hypothetical protein [Roseomonas sp.]